MLRYRALLTFKDVKRVTKRTRISRMTKIIRAYVYLIEDNKLSYKDYQLQWRVGYNNDDFIRNQHSCIVEAVKITKK